MESLLNMFLNYSLNYSECLLCGALVPRNIHIKFCMNCCSNIININNKLIIIERIFDTKRSNVLETRLGITCRKDFHKWAARNHPDKGGNPEIFRKVCQLVERKYPK